MRGRFHLYVNGELHVSNQSLLSALAEALPDIEFTRDFYSIPVAT